MRVFKITFDRDEEAREEEFEIRDNMGSLVDTVIDSNTVYITGPQAAAIAKYWYKGRNVEEIEMTESQFNSILNPKKPKRYEARVEFISEDAAYDAMDIWKNVQHPSIRPMSAFDPWTQKQLAIARRMADVEVEKDGETLIIHSSSKAKVIEAVAIFNEDEDSVVSSSKPKRISESDMTIEDALLILESENLKATKSPEQIEAEKARRKERRMARRLKERRENEVMKFKYSVWSPLRYSDELWNYVGRYKRELDTWAVQNSKRGQKISIRTDSDHDDYYVVKFYIEAPRKFKDYLENFFESKKTDAPWWMDYGISGLRMERI